MSQLCDYESTMICFFLCWGHGWQTRFRWHRKMMKSFGAAALPRLVAWYGFLDRSQKSSNPKKCYRWFGRTAARCLASGLDDYPRGLYVNDDECHLDLHSWMLLFARTSHASACAACNRSILWSDELQQLHIHFELCLSYLSCFYHVFIMSLSFYFPCPCLVHGAKSVVNAVRARTLATLCNQPLGVTWDRAHRRLANARTTGNSQRNRE